jgi:mRNA degradation ribonuclease J1/J2
MSRVRIVPLGLGEIGMNGLSGVSGPRGVLIDCGVTFMDAHIGVDLVPKSLLTRPRGIPGMDNLITIFRAMRESQHVNLQAHSVAA